ncbi:unnamed protein product [Peronospora belbahrii]|uniref:Uncharacterized protein n=1 Tax=Peronospora belbahrii TaxID=622444 RepID=A0ABN8CSE6_9STRA|nr:unnamed protein product [Peronospora belbahrii]
MLERVSGTALNSKLISRHKQFFSPMVRKKMMPNLCLPFRPQTGHIFVVVLRIVDAVLSLDDGLDISIVGIKKILLLNVELELKSEKENAEIILSKLPVGDLATQCFADHGLFCAGRVSSGRHGAYAACHAAVWVQASVIHDMNPSVLGSCGRFEERRVGNERYNIFMECAEAKKAPRLPLRGGAELFIEGGSPVCTRCAHGCGKRAVASSTVVAGGGAIEMKVSRYLRQYARTIEGKAQLFGNILKTLRKASGLALISPRVASVTHMSRTCGNLLPTKINSIAAATEAACLILSVDETVRNPKSEQPQAGSGGGAPMSAAMGGQGMRGMMGGGRGGPSGMGRGVRALRGKGDCINVVAAPLGREDVT